ncbi:hypothetical protein K466DRAFT_402433 [Polyporus arcularius HHB13444]|uniref:Fungal-type protein kinase domain-containing protein n=1 Tax=Polyporus arcularius HHB13444 TaxID=1314778 RepID=A0A5C3PK45_9APHY|nr:hypothetical protein K466DRAFT_402433 [Polyporus arcularius HHB13444]
MSTIKRSPKSGNDWTPTDLFAYNIHVVYQDSASFFGITDLPHPQVDDEILVARNAATTQHDDSYALLRTLELAQATAHGQESAVTDFLVALFRTLRYTGRHDGRITRTRKDFRFWVCGKERHAKTDVCIIDETPDILLVVQEDKRHLHRSDPEPQLIAQAIAAFHRNYMTRVRGYGLPGPTSTVMPGITMKGTMPTFYKIPVTADLVRAVQLGEYPQQETVVYAHIPAVPRAARRYDEGMQPLDNRRIILSCFEAFKHFL